MSRDHMASAASIGSVTGKRVGTTYAHDPVRTWEIMGRPNFRFRNDEERQKFFAWQDRQIEEMKAATKLAFPKVEGA